MNPETKATTEQIQAICEKYNIEYKFHSRIEVGFNHELHRINDDLVIKIYNVYGDDDSKRFGLESALLGSPAHFLKPKLITSDSSRKIIDRDYIIMSYVAGKSLGSVWHLATDSQRENLIKVICNSLKIINTIDFPEFKQAMTADWATMIRDRFEAHVSSLLVKSVIDNATAERIRLFFAKSKTTLSGSALYSVFWDVHFDNFIVDENFSLQAIIDLESVRIAALDYPLFVINKMTDNPKTYLSEEDEKYADKRDYILLKSWYKKYYPEMFAFDYLEQRVKCYMILDTLHMLEDWSHIKRIYDELDMLLS